MHAQQAANNVVIVSTAKTNKHNLLDERSVVERHL